MRLRVLARAPPCKDDRSIHDLARAGKRLRRTHAGILPGKAVGRGDVEKGCHEIVPRRVAEKVTDASDICKSKIAIDAQACPMSRTRPQIR
jgi:hypothetical protein